MSIQTKTIHNQLLHDAQFCLAEILKKNGNRADKETTPELDDENRLQILKRVSMLCTRLQSSRQQLGYSDVMPMESLWLSLSEVRCSSNGVLKAKAQEVFEDLAMMRRSVANEVQVFPQALPRRVLNLIEEYEPDKLVRLRELSFRDFNMLRNDIDMLANWIVIECIKLYPDCERMAQKLNSFMLDASIDEQIYFYLIFEEKLRVDVKGEKKRGEIKLFFHRFFWKALSKEIRVLWIDKYLSSQAKKFLENDLLNLEKLVINALLSEDDLREIITKTNMPNLQMCHLSFPPPSIEVLSEFAEKFNLVQTKKGIFEKLPPNEEGNKEEVWC